MTGVATILHVDMDAFFAAVEQHDRPELRGRPVVVGSPPDRRGVVSTCSYEARRFGIHSAMPSRTAWKLCPQAVFLPVNMSRYKEVSATIMELFGRFTPLVEPLSLDEAFLDVTGASYLFGDGPTVARKIQASVVAETGLTCSVGVAPNLFLAKVASDLHKPSGLTVTPVDAEQIAAFLAPLPVKRMWGAGRKTQEVLAAHGIHTFRDLQTANPVQLAAQVGVAAAESFRRLAFGRDDRAVRVGGREKSISNEITFEEDLRAPAAVEAALLDLVDHVGVRLRRAGLYTDTAHLKVRWSDFSTQTRQRRLRPSCCDDITLRESALELLHKEPLLRPVRLIGFGVSGLHTTADPAQLGLFQMPDEEQARRRENLSRAVDRLRERFGADSIRRGSAPGDSG
jgi:nucleotidyltransferase/DNA polymerase involved in DNA repair